MKHLLILVLLTLTYSSFAKDEQILDQLVWDFSGFVNSFGSKDWPQVYQYITEETKVGFGGEYGIAGVKSTYIENKTCFEDMLFALKQGCKKTGSDKHAECIAPPQWADPEVISLGARASFIYNEQRKRWVAKFLICGGD